MYDSSTIKCCYKCVPPKRHLGCHEACEEYLKERAEYEKRKDMIAKTKYQESYFNSRVINERDLALKKRREAKYAKAHNYK